ncbi:uncharacterized protein [Littorina saxatilis]|uniref:uncharacterized protein n=1 Tax=Littorina saxatilis TaxID=31220 RepID=UPI0038B47319
MQSFKKGELVGQCHSCTTDRASYRVPTSPTKHSVKMRCHFLSILTVLAICVNHASADDCTDGMDKCLNNYMDIVYSATTAEQFCQYYKTFYKCITLACPSLNGTLELPPEAKKRVDDGMKSIGVNCDAPVGSQGAAFHGFTAPPGSKPGCIEQTKNCTRWYVNVVMDAHIEKLCGNLHTFASCVTEACGVKLTMNQTQLHEIQKPFEDNGIQCDVSDLFQMAASTNGNKAAGTKASSAGDRGHDPSNDSSCIISNARLLPLATLLVILRIFLN